MKILKIGRLTLLTGVLGIGLVSSPGLLAQALTPAQLTLRIEENSRALAEIQKDLKRMNTLMDNRAMLDIFQRVDELADEISQLRGELELQASELTGIKTRQRELYLDIDRRMRDIEDRAAGQSSTLAPVPVPAAGTSSTGSSQVSAGSSTTGTSSGSQVVPAPQPSANLSEEKAAYQVAFDSLKEGRYKQARQQFSQFLKDYPASIYEID
jgi:TolA-binding protein